MSKNNTYLSPLFLENINKSEVSTIIECGAADGEDTVGIYNHYNANVYAFECDPTLLLILRKKADSRIHVIENGLWSEECSREFLCVDRDKSVNKTMGISSMYKWANLPGENARNPLYLIQTPILVQCTAIDAFCEKNDVHPDML